MPGLRMRYSDATIKGKKMENVQLSIIIPIFNGKHFLAEAMENVLKMRCSNVNFLDN